MRGGVNPATAFEWAKAPMSCSPPLPSTGHNKKAIKRSQTVDSLPGYGFHLGLVNQPQDGNAFLLEQGENSGRGGGGWRPLEDPTGGQLGGGGVGCHFLRCKTLRCTRLKIRCSTPSRRNRRFCCRVVPDTAATHTPCGRGESFREPADEAVGKRRRPVEGAATRCLRRRCPSPSHPPGGENGAVGCAGHRAKAATSPLAPSAPHWSGKWMVSKRASQIPAGTPSIRAIRQGC